MLLSSLDLHQEKSHSVHLVSSIKYLLESCGIENKEIDAVAISKGPGSYTGLRIGTSTAKGICYAVDAKLIAINTLESMAFGASLSQHEKVLLCPMIDARRMEVYCLLADTEFTIISGTEAKIIEKNSFAEQLENKKILFFGDGAKKCKKVLGGAKNAVFLEGIHPSAIHTGTLAWKAFNNNQFEDLAYFEPFYLKDFIAKKPSAKKMV